MQRLRLPAGGRIDRARPLTFRFNGTAYSGYAGDTLAAALLANGIHLVGRSFKYHRPRGIVGGGTEEPNALVQIGRGARTLPNQPATQVELYDGLESTSVNGWPSVRYDVLASLSLLGRFLPAGFYYKTFMWPGRWWPVYERVLRRAAGLGRAPAAPDLDTYEKVNAHCDVLVVGAGPAGLAAAVSAGRTGARVILADEQPAFGGSLLGTRERIDGAPALDWVQRVEAELAGMGDVRMVRRATVTGYYDHSLLLMHERLTHHLAPSLAAGPRERLWRVRAQHVVLATGAIERPLVFANNDRPGVMLASAVATYVNRYAVAAGRRPLIFTNNDSAYRTALDLLAQGVAVAGVVDVRPHPEGELAAAVRRLGLPIHAGQSVVAVRGTVHVRAVTIRRIDATGSGVEGPAHEIACDALAMSGGWSPAVHLYAQAGGRARWEPAQACFVPGPLAQTARTVGACHGAFTLAACLAEGRAAGAAAARAAGFGDGVPRTDLPWAEDARADSIRAVWLAPGSRPVSRASKAFVDLREDVTAADLALAVREGFQSIEHVKRYTTLGMGVDQGKLSNVNGLGVVATVLGVDVAQVGTTTYRPMVTPVSFGALAGRDVGPLADVTRLTPLQRWHEEAGARFENVGQWRRAWYYPRPGESMRAAVARECRAVRRDVGILDYSTLGKIDIQGPDALELLNRVYTTSLTRLPVGRCRYGLMLGEDGMIFDDGVTARLGPQHYFMFTTTSGTARVLGWLERWLQTEWPALQVYLTSVSDHWCDIAIAGPKSRALVAAVCPDIDFAPTAFPFMAVRTGTVAGVPARVFRISFSGELSYEINVPACYGRAVWEALIAAGAPSGITPYGTEALHVLRAEKGLAIVGQETDGSVTPGDLGLDRLVAPDKDCLGKRSLARPDARRPDRKQLVGLLTLDPTEVLPEGGQVVAEPNAPIPVPMIGHVTSSYFSANVGRSIALALVKGGRARLGQTVYVPRLDRRTVPALIVSPVFYDPEEKRRDG